MSRRYTSSSPRREHSPQLSRAGPPQPADAAGRPWPAQPTFSHRRPDAPQRAPYSSRAPPQGRSSPPPAGASAQLQHGWALRGALSRAFADAGPTADDAGERRRTEPGPPARAPTLEPLLPPPPPQPPPSSDSQREPPSPPASAGRPMSPRARFRQLQERIRAVVRQHSDSCDAEKVRAQAEQYTLLVLSRNDPRVLRAVMNCPPDEIDLDELRATLLGGAARADDAAAPDGRRLSIHLSAKERLDGSAMTLVTAQFQEEGEAKAAASRLNRGVLNLKTGRLRPAQESSETDAVERMSQCCEWLEEEYDEKGGDVVDELLENLRMPEDVSADAAADRLAALARSLAGDDKVQRSPLGECCLAELLCLRQYTERPIDVDRDLGFQDVPPPPHRGEAASQVLARSTYEQQWEDWNWSGSPPTKRNGSIFGPVCAALRDLGPGGTSSAASAAVLRRWVKWVCTIAAVTAQRRPSYQTLFRGIGAGGLSREVVEQHRALHSGGLLAWCALSSTSLDAQQSEEYMRGTAANSTSKPTPHRPGTLLFHIEGAKWGVPLEPLSAYPAEHEILLPPLSVLRVEGSEADAHNAENGLRMRLAMLGPLGPAPREAVARCERFFARVRADAQKASERLANCGTAAPRAAASAGVQPPPQAERMNPLGAFSGSSVGGVWKLGGAAMELALCAAPRGLMVSWNGRRIGAGAALAAHHALARGKKKKKQQRPGHAGAAAAAAAARSPRAAAIAASARTGLQTVPAVDSDDSGTDD
eukprot:TRINITY_DN1719_c0_g1_i1.p1 TRINITY_DN1719_c0_g1~~TRINITY_DN1719_c0_g1_i1.p1  ORF type:complete len:761 (+),score=263.93 TRINITY_DN1719_c0_g1_i1:118-2400(+)